jgi:hypothetical protein
MPGRNNAARLWALAEPQRRAAYSRAWIWLLALLVGATACTRAEGDEAPVDSGPHVLVDVAEDVGLAFRHGVFRWDVAPDPGAMMGGGLCWVDYDGDGWLDLFVVNSFALVEASRWKEGDGLPTTALFHNQGGTFTDVSDAAGANLELRGMGCVAGDFDLDGHVDLFITTEWTDRLLWNAGDGTFVEGGAEAGLDAYGWHSGAAVGDLNGDQWPDLVVAGYADTNNLNPDATEGFPDAVLPVRDRLYLSNGPREDGRVTFREVGAEAGLEARTEYGRPEYGLGVVVVDVDRDGDLDVYVANDTNPNRLYRNVPWPGGAAADPLGLGFRFEEVSTAAGVDDDRAGMGVAPGDYNADRGLDFFVTNSREQGHGVFSSTPSEEAALAYNEDSARFGETYTGWGVSWIDLDLDTDLDLVLANGDIPITDLVDDAQPLQAFVNPGDLESRFEDASSAFGLGAVGRLHGRGSAAADYDNDGDLDVAVNSIAGPLVLLENRGTDGNWLEVGLVGFHPGARVRVVLPDGRTLVRDLLAGSSYLSSEDPRAHFGLGSATVVPELVVTWPDGKQTRLTDVDANQLIEVTPPRS